MAPARLDDDCCKDKRSGRANKKGERLLLQLETAIGQGLETTRIEAQLAIFDQPMRVSVAVDNHLAGLADVVVLARMLADRIVEATRRNCAVNGLDVPCRCGCAHCCRYLVPMSVPELMLLAREMPMVGAAELPGVLARITEAESTLALAGRPPAPEATLTLSDGTTLNPTEAIGHWYWQLGLDCPFLLDDVCLTYPRRPISCRQHLVTSTAEYCRSFQPGKGRIRNVPVDCCHGLALLAAELEQSPLESVMLPMAMRWISTNQHRIDRKWPRPVLFGRFLEIVQQLSQQQ